MHAEREGGLSVMHRRRHERRSQRSLVHLLCHGCAVRSEQQNARQSNNVTARTRPRPDVRPFLPLAFVLLWAFAPSARAQLLPFPLPAQTDKVLHAGACAVVVDGVWLGAAALDQPLWIRLVAGVSAGAVVGVGKEAADLAGLGTPDAADLLFDGFGIGLGVAFALLAEVAADRITENNGANNGANNDANNETIP